MAGTNALSSTLLLQSSLLFPSKSSRRVFYSTFRFNMENGALLRCSAKKKLSFMDQILDYIEGGPKLRKWYGAPDLLPKDGSTVEDEDDFAGRDEIRDAVLVTDGDSEIGQMVILSLIVKRARVKALVKDKRAALEAFGTYVESMTGDANDKPLLRKALRGVRSIICPNEGFFSNAGSLKGVQHIILLSQLSVYRGTGGIQSLIKSNAKKLAEQDESVLMGSGIPYTIIRAGSLQNTPGGKQGFSFEEGCAATGSLSKEDAAFICVEALDAVPETGFIFEVVNGEEKVSDWKQCLVRLMDESRTIKSITIMHIFFIFYIWSFKFW
ncbi:NAD(P)-binding Rossmann-fold superfamily protein [Quillaja saponaria]|uniref:NAD(P)-binding Rossmann-fold superfamily protein n=1 Tax=Quillaja saponaria TaxID=32244 RepID=A0AAD7PQB1_QUISA|nr:NAD(P)-binding Rossmann-fold superfamily protein [Quillaja saponaria]